MSQMKSFLLVTSARSALMGILTVAAAHASPAAGLSGAYRLSVGDRDCAPGMVIRTSGDALMVYLLGATDSSGELRDYQIGKSSSGLMPNIDPERGFRHYRQGASFASDIYSKVKTQVTVNSDEISILQEIKFVDQTGIWIPQLYSTSEVSHRTQLLKRLGDGDVQYFVSENSKYDASGNQPAGEANRTLNCRYTVHH